MEDYQQIVIPVAMESFSFHQQMNALINAQLENMIIMLIMYVQFVMFLALIV